MASPSRLTTRGRAFVSAGVTSVVCAVVLGQNDLVRVGILVSVLPLLSYLVVARHRQALASARDVPLARVAVGQSTEVSLRVVNEGRTTSGMLMLEDQVPYVLGNRPRFVLDELRPSWHRSLTYTLRSEVRGRFTVGPLRVRLTDPFGLVEVNRSFRAVSTVVVIPRVLPLPATDVSGDFSGAGDSRPRAFAATGSEDVTVREYRQGDDLRRIHWKSTARVGELMVRREEQPHQSRATLLLDTRRDAHAGSGSASSFEHAVSIIASVAAHLSARGFTLRVLTDLSLDSDTAWHDRGISQPEEIQLILDQLAVVESGAGHDLSHVLPADPGSHGMLVAVLGQLAATDVASLAMMRPPQAHSCAFLLDTRRRGRAAGTTPDRGVEEQAAALRSAGWEVVVVSPGDDVATLWRGLTGGRSTRAGAPA